MKTLRLSITSLWHKQSTPLLNSLAEKLCRFGISSTNSHQSPSPTEDIPADLVRQILVDLLPPLLAQFRPHSHPKGHKRGITKSEVCNVLLDALNYALCLDVFVNSNDKDSVTVSKKALQITSATRIIKILLLVALCGVVREMPRDKIMSILLPSLTSSSTLTPSVPSTLSAATNLDIILHTFLTSASWTSQLEHPSNEVSWALCTRYCIRDILKSFFEAIIANIGDSRQSRAARVLETFIETLMTSFSKTQLITKNDSMTMVLLTIYSDLLCLFPLVSRITSPIDRAHRLCTHFSITFLPILCTGCTLPCSPILDHIMQTLTDVGSFLDNIRCGPDAETQFGADLEHVLGHFAQFVQIIRTTFEAKMSSSSSSRGHRSRQNLLNKQNSTLLVQWTCTFLPSSSLSFLTNLFISFLEHLSSHQSEWDSIAMILHDIMSIQGHRSLNSSPLSSSALRTVQAILKKWIWRWSIHSETTCTISCPSCDTFYLCHSSTKRLATIRLCCIRAISGESVHAALGTPKEVLRGLTPLLATSSITLRKMVVKTCMTITIHVVATSKGGFFDNLVDALESKSRNITTLSHCQHSFMAQAFGYWAFLITRHLHTNLHSEKDLWRELLRNLERICENMENDRVKENAEVVMMIVPQILAGLLEGSRSIPSNIPLSQVPRCELAALLECAHLLWRLRCSTDSFVRKSCLHVLGRCLGFGHDKSGKLEKMEVMWESDESSKNNEFIEKFKTEDDMESFAILFDIIQGIYPFPWQNDKPKPALSQADSPELKYLIHQLLQDGQKAGTLPPLKSKLYKSSTSSFVTHNDENQQRKQNSIFSSGNDRHIIHENKYEKSQSSTAELLTDKPRERQEKAAPLLPPIDTLEWSVQDHVQETKTQVTETPLTVAVEDDEDVMAMFEPSYQDKTSNTKARPLNESFFFSSSPFGKRRIMPDVILDDYIPKGNSQQSAKKNSRSSRKDNEKPFDGSVDVLDFEWSASDISKPNCKKEASYIGDLGMEGVLGEIGFEFSGYEDSNNVISQEDEDVVTGPLLSFSTTSSSFMQPSSSPQLIRTRIKSAIEAFLKQLPFSTEQKGLYQVTITSRLPETPRLTSRTTLEFDEALHPHLKKVFQLDPSLMIEYCAGLVTDSPSKNRNDIITLDEWISRLTDVHHHLLPMSRILFNLERQLGGYVSLAQAMVIIKDQIYLMRMYSSNNKVV